MWTNTFQIVIASEVSKKQKTSSAILLHSGNMSVWSQFHLSNVMPVDCLVAGGRVFIMFTFLTGVCGRNSIFQAFDAFHKGLTQWGRGGSRGFLQLGSTGIFSQLSRCPEHRSTSRTQYF